MYILGDTPIIMCVVLYIYIYIYIHKVKIVIYIYIYIYIICLLKVDPSIEKHAMELRKSQSRGSWQHWANDIASCPHKFSWCLSAKFIYKVRTHTHMDNFQNTNFIYTNMGIHNLETCYELSYVNMHKCDHMKLTSQFITFKTSKFIDTNSNTTHIQMLWLTICTHVSLMEFMCQNICSTCC